jgi:outer membrane protein assembly factor BamD
MIPSSLRLRVVTVLLAALTLVSACGKGDPKLPAPGSSEPDKFLFDRGTQLLKDKNWLAAREYFRKIVDTYPNSTYRQSAKLGIGDSYLGEGHIDSVILGANEFREFLQYFPLHERADYATYRICYAASKQMLSSQRDQTATNDAIRDCDTFLRNQAYAASPYRAEVEKLRRQARDRLSEYEFNVGLTYYQMRNPIGAINRLSQLLGEDPSYTQRDAVYFYFAESLLKLERKAEALPLYERLVAEFPKSKFLKKAKERILELKK